MPNDLIDLALSARLAFSVVISPRSGRAKLSFGRQGVKFKIPRWRALSPAVSLSPQALRQEKLRVLAIARALPVGQVGTIDLKPHLEFPQCWSLVRYLDAKGFTVVPNGRKDSRGFTRFKFNPDGSLTLWVQPRPHRVDKRAVPALHDALAEKLGDDGAQGANRDPGRRSRARKNNHAGVEKGARVVALLRQLGVPPSSPGDWQPPAPMPRRFMRGQSKPPRRRRSDEPH